MVNINKNPPWFRTAKKCPYSDLTVSHAETFISRHPGSDYFVDVAKLGDRILLIKASGYVRSYEMIEALQSVDEYMSARFDHETPVFIVEDYADVAGADVEARRAYIRHHKSSEVIWGCVLYNLPLLFRISFNIAKRLHARDELLYAAESYPLAIDLAREVILRRGAGDSPDKNQDPRSQTFLEKSSERAKQVYRFFLERMHRFSPHSLVHRIDIIKRQYAEALLEYIKSIDWQVDGIRDPEGKTLSDPMFGQAVAAIAYIKSEIDDLLRERDAREKVLKESEARYRRLVKHARAGILEFDCASNRIISVNDSFLDICGYSKTAIMSIHPEELMTDASRKLFRDRMKMRMEGMPLPDDDAYEFFTKSGEKKWVLPMVKIHKKAGRPPKADVVIIDITRIKNAEDQLLQYQSRLKALTIELSRTEERQRRDLASQLHESVCQELFAAQLKLVSLKHFITDAGQLRRLDEVEAEIVKSIREIQSITYDLSPPVLYDLGLPEAIKSLARALESRHGLNVTVSLAGESGNLGDFTNETKQIIYRVVKEILQNAVKHARADRAVIFIERTDNDLLVDVTDNGIGFDASIVTGNHYYGGGFGLLDIREKIQYLGGDLRICSTLGEGTRVSLAVPLNPA